MTPSFPAIAMAFAAVSLSACSLEMPFQSQTQPVTPAAPAPKPVPVMPDDIAEHVSKAGMCYAYVQAETDGSYTVFTGVGNGTVTPQGGQAKANLSAAGADAAYAKEVGIMKINPECLTSFASGRPKDAALPQG